jgi:hypothetical protein
MPRTKTIANGLPHQTVRFTSLNTYASYRLFQGPIVYQTRIFFGVELSRKDFVLGIKVRNG